ncbi:MAG TPA: Ig domain-containing protein [Clostridiales bacterium]|nr:Ig domain-containing protein [Clostridiales bacterium]
MKIMTNGKKIVSALLLLCFVAVNSITPVKADAVATTTSTAPTTTTAAVANAITFDLNSGVAKAKIADQQTTQYHKLVLPSPGYLRIQIYPGFDVECSFMNEGLTKTYFSATYKKNYYKGHDSGEYESVGSYFEAGTYCYAVKGVSSGGDYTLEAEFIPVENNEIEPNQTFDQAMELTGGAIKGFISEDDDVDIYSVKLGKNQSFVLKPLGYDQLDVNWLRAFTVYDSSFNKINSPYILYGPEVFQWSEGTYYIKVTRDNTSSPRPQGTYGFEYNIIDHGADKAQYAYYGSRFQEIYVNATLTSAKPIILPASTTDQKFVWKSSDTKIATVSASGKVTGKKAGSAVITATCADNPALSASYKIVVRPISLTLSKYNVGLKVGKKYTIKPTSVIGASNKVTYTSSNKKIVTVNKNGVVTAKKAGTAKIKVQANGLTKYVTFKVTKK